MEPDPIISPSPPCVDHVLIPLSKGKGFAKVSPKDMGLAQSYKLYLINGYAAAVKDGKTIYLRQLPPRNRL